MLFSPQTVKFLFACIFTVDVSAFTCGFFQSFLQMAVQNELCDAHYRVCDLIVLCEMWMLKCIRTAAEVLCALRC